MHFLKTSAKRVCKILVFVTFLTTGCYTGLDSTVDQTVANSTTNADADSNLKLVVQRPTGKELTLTVRVVAPRKAIITVTNNSDTDIYTTYIPGGKDKFAIYAILNEERMDPVTKDFKLLKGNHFGTGFHALPAHDLFNETFFVPHSGKYRVSIRYLVDAGLAKRINGLASLNGAERMAEEKSISSVDEIATHTIMSEPFEL